MNKGADAGDEDNYEYQAYTVMQQSLCLPRLRFEY